MYVSKVMPSLDKMDHFELLDVAIDATPREVQKSFLLMATSLHPDRHRLHLEPEDLEKVTIVYARIAEAYRVLRNKKEKAQYLKTAAINLDKNAEPEVLTETDSFNLLSPKAQRLFKRYKAALRRGDSTSAMLFLRGALSMHPQSQFLKEELSKRQ